MSCGEFKKHKTFVDSAFQTQTIFYLLLSEMRPNHISKKKKSYLMPIIENQLIKMLKAEVTQLNGRVPAVQGHMHFYFL